jgi:hypothetical protein
LYFEAPAPVAAILASNALTQESKAILSDDALEIAGASTAPAMTMSRNFLRFMGGIP